MGIVTIAVTWDSATRKKDRSVRLSFTSNLEVSNDDFAEMDRLVQGEGWLLFKSNAEVDLEEIPTEDAPSEGKSFIQRLRAVKFLQWKQGNQEEPFNLKWERYKEAFLEKEKERLE